MMLSPAPAPKPVYTCIEPELAALAPPTQLFDTLNKRCLEGTDALKSCAARATPLIFPDLGLEAVSSVGEVARTFLALAKAKFAQGQV